MIRYGDISERSLSTCHPDIIRVMRRVALICPAHLDHRILTGHRNREDQDEAFRTGASFKRWPDSEHNTLPSRAFDFVPLPLDWADTRQFAHVAGFILAVGAMEAVPLRWLGDPNQNGKTLDSKLGDWGHIELL